MYRTALMLLRWILVLVWIDMSCQQTVVYCLSLFFCSDRSLCTCFSLLFIHFILPVLTGEICYVWNGNFKWLLHISWEDLIWWASYNWIPLQFICIPKLVCVCVCVCTCNCACTIAGEANLHQIESSLRTTYWWKTSHSLLDIPACTFLTIIRNFSSPRWFAITSTWEENNWRQNQDCAWDCRHAWPGVHQIQRSNHCSRWSQEPRFGWQSCHFHFHCC